LWEATFKMAMDRAEAAEARTADLLKALQTYRELFGRSDLQRAGLSPERVNEVWEMGKAAVAGAKE